MNGDLSDYALGERLHHGPRSVVYRASRRSDGAACVVKIQHSDRPNARDVERFTRQFDIARLLPIEGVVQALGLARHNHRMALVMEDFGAVPLSAYLGARRLPLADALDVGIQTTEVLGQIHARGVVHKDINPANVVIHPQSKRVKIIDFGLSDTLSREAPWVRSPNLLEGTIRYISPEQTGRMNRNIDYRTDFYSLGAMLYEMFAGVPPFESLDALELVHAHIAITPPSLVERDARIPRALSDVVMKLLAKTAEDRYQSAQGVVLDLTTVRDALATGANLEGFVPGAHDISDRFQIPQKLYGRETEANVLRTAVDRVGRGRSELVLVAGYAGIGKSALVAEVHKPLVRSHGYFTSGKFDQLKRDVAYASIIDAFQDLMRQILAESEERLDGWKRTLAAALGPNAAVIAEVIPAVEFILGRQPLPVALGPAEAQNRLHFAFSRFVQALASPEHPLVVFLDDLQWADAPSLTLIRHLMTDVETSSFCLIGAYRDNEVTATHPLPKIVEEVRAAGTPVTTILLEPLDLDDVTQLVEDTLRCIRARATPLAELLHNATEGNPFFLNQLLAALFEERLFEFDGGARAWRWDLDAIRQRGVKGDVVELVARKILRLSAAAQQALKLAACIGNRFDMDTLAVVARRSPAEMASSCREALEQGLILPIGDAYFTAAARRVSEGTEDVGRASFRFLHDRVQQAAYSLIETHARADIHLDLGRLLLASAPPDTLEESIVDMVNQFGLGLDRLTDTAERYEVATLALRAGRKAKASAAFAPALRYLLTGVKLLAPDAFTAQHELAFSLHVEAAEAEYLNTNFDGAETLAAVAMTHADSTLEKLKVYETRMLCALSQNRFDPALRLGLEALALVGVNLPFEATGEHFGAALARNHALLAGRAIESLVDLPPMTDPSMIAAQRIQVHMGAPAYMSNPLLFLLNSAESFALCLQHGNSRSAPVAYVTYGSVHAAALKDPLTARAYGDLAVKVMEKYDARESKSEVYLLRAALILHWSMPLRDTFPLLDEAFQSGVETGDIQHAAHTGSNLCTSPFVAGEPLGPHHTRISSLIDFYCRHKHDMLRLYNSVLLQAVEGLLGRAADPLVLTGAAFDETRDLATLLEAKSYSSVANFHSLKAMVAYIFGDHERARAESEAAEPFAPAVAGMPGSAQMNLYQSLAVLACYPAANDEDRAKYRVIVERNQADLKKWAEHAPFNIAHKHDLVEAELRRIDGRTTEAIALYQKAIRGAAEQRYLHEEAVANERCADLCRSLGWGRPADAYLTDAYYAYMRWGATAKVAQLEALHPALLAGESPSVPRSPTSLSSTVVSSTSGANLELASVMKAAQAISGEIVLPRLTQMLLRIMVENAGAQRGVLLLQRDGRLAVEAAWATEQSGVSSGEGGGEAVAASIVGYVARTGESVVLSDAAREGRFTKDTYVAASRPRSILCAPLLNQGALVAVIYLENNLVEGAFTDQRLEVLKVLSGQAVLSIHNAMLFATLESKVEERTRELREKNEELLRAQRQLATQEKLASLGVLTAGIAHELRNPLNFINNFASLTVDLTADLTADFEAVRQRLPTSEQENLQETLALVGQNVSKIHEHGKRADQIIAGMLQHSRGGQGDVTPTDLNAVLARSVALAAHSARDRAPALDIEIVADLDDQVGTIDAMAADISRVFINVISNACYAVSDKQKRTAAYAPRIEIRSRSLGDRVEVRVRDNGTGIPAGIVDKIFMPFFTTKPTGEGTGLGLSISHDLVVQSHHGEMVVDAAEGEYAEFIIRLPRKQPRA